MRKITPGTPKNPAINAVTALIPIAKPKLAPTKLTKNKSMAPNTPLTISLNNILIGHANNLTIINKISNANRKYPANSIPILISPLG